jgi:hypothetical protein
MVDYRSLDKICLVFTGKDDGFFMDKLARLYVNEVTRLHGISIFIVSDQDPRFTSRL